jgi:hypothetical protein
MGMVDFPRTVVHYIDKLPPHEVHFEGRGRTSLNEGFELQVSPQIPDPRPRIPEFGAHHSAVARPKGIGARYSQSAVALLLYR